MLHLSPFSHPLEELHLPTLTPLCNISSPLSSRLPSMRKCSKHRPTIILPHNPPIPSLCLYPLSLSLSLNPLGCSAAVLSVALLNLLFQGKHTARSDRQLAHCCHHMWAEINYILLFMEKIKKANKRECCPLLVPQQFTTHIRSIFFYARIHTFIVRPTCARTFSNHSNVMQLSTSVQLASFPLSGLCSHTKAESSHKHFG